MSYCVTAIKKYNFFLSIVILKPNNLNRLKILFNGQTFFGQTVTLFLNPT